MHAEQVGPMPVDAAHGGPLCREALSDLRREGFEVVHGGQKAGYTSEPHAHDFDARIMVLGGEITLIREGKAEVFRAGDHCEVPAGCMHSECVGPEGFACIAGKAHRRTSSN
jgi:quercetin dioxygenase-like cupin family protein